MTLSIIYTTARKNCQLDWFIDSLCRECKGVPECEVIVIDYFHGQRVLPANVPEMFSSHPCKPCVWQGEHRLTKDDWWAKSACLNTGLCLAKGTWIACVDDRSVLMPGWLHAVKQAIKGEYCVAGSYQKHVNIRVENGTIMDSGTCVGVDPRNPRRASREAVKTYGDKWYGCTCAFPLKAALDVNGFDESCDGMRYEDTVFGNMLAMNGYVTQYDPKMFVMQDRTMPDAEMTLKGMDKGISPNDKSHALLKRVGGSKRATHDFDLNGVRNWVHAGNHFPIPSGPTHDWYDGQPLSELSEFT